MVTQNWHFSQKIWKTNSSTQQSNKNKYKVKTEFTRAAIIAKSLDKSQGSTHCWNRMLSKLI